VLGVNISFVPPTPDNGTNTADTSALINVSINTSSLANYSFEWNGANYSYYDPSVVLMYNLDNNSAVGDSDTMAADVSGHGNSGTCLSGNCDWVASGKYHGAISTTNNYISTDLDPGDTFTISLWFKANVINSDDGIFSVNNNRRYSCMILSNVLYCYSDSNYWTSCLSMSANQYAEQLDAPDHEGTRRFEHHGLHKRRAARQQALRPYSTSGTLRIGDYYHGGYRFDGTIDEVRVYNRTLSDGEVYQQYLSNLYKHSSDSWEFTANETPLAPGTYAYLACANDSFGSSNCTELRTLNISFVPAPNISFVPPTPDNGTNISSGSAILNVSINSSSLANFTWNWGKTNYSFYDSSLVLMYTFDNVSVLGENPTSTFVSDSSVYGNDGSCHGMGGGCAWTQTANTMEPFCSTVG